MQKIDLLTPACNPNSPDFNTKQWTCARKYIGLGVTLSLYIGQMWCEVEKFSEFPEKNFDCCAVFKLFTHNKQNYLPQTPAIKHITACISKAMCCDINIVFCDSTSISLLWIIHREILPIPIFYCMLEIVFKSHFLAVAKCRQNVRQTNLNFNYSMKSLP